MAGKNKVELTLAGDEKDLSRALARSEGSVDDFAQNVVQAGDKAVAALKDVDKAAQSIQPAELKINSNMIPAAKKDLKDLENAGQDLKPVKLEAKVDEGHVKEGLSRAGEVGSEAFAGSFLGALAGGDLVGGIAEMIGSGLDAVAEQKNLIVDLQNQMGVTPEQAKDYGARVGKAYADGFGSSKADIAEVYSTLSSDVQNWSNLTQDEQDKIARNHVKVVDAFGADTQEVIKATSSMVANKLVPSFEAATDLVTLAFQTLGSRGDDALETLNEYSGYFTQLGIQGPAALGLIQQALKAGARDTDYAADVWKEVGIRLLDTATTTTDALKDLFKGTKTNIHDLQEELAAGGPKAEAALEKVITKLQGIKDPLEKQKIGVALFGTQYEDTFKRVIEQTDLAKAKMTDYQGATDKLAQHQRTLTDQIGQLWDTVNLKVGQAITNITDEISKGTLIDTISLSLRQMTGSLDETTKAAYTFGISIDGTNRGIADLAATVGGPGTQQFGKLINSMSDTQLAALGVSVKLDELGRKVLTLPDGNIVIIDNTGQVSGNVDALVQKARDMSGKTFFLNIVQRVTTQGSGNQNLPLPFGGYSEGGPVIGPGTTTSDKVIARLSNKEFVEPANVASRYQPELERLRHGASWEEAGGWRPTYMPMPVGGQGPRRLVVAGNADNATGRFINELISRGIIRVA